MSRDAQGRVHGAPAWSGDLTTLTDIELRERITSLGNHLGRCTTVWHSLDGWRAATPAELKAREWDRWVTARLAALHERDRRDNSGGAR